METTEKNLIARFYNQTIVKLADALMPLYSLISDLTEDLEINAPIHDFPATVGELDAIDPRTSWYILHAVEWPNDGLNDVRLKIALRKAIGVEIGFKG